MILILLLGSWPGPAHAAEALAFTPDRPGVGDSTGTPGRGHVMVEGGLSAAPGPVRLGLGGVVGRFGIDEALEVRLRLPSVPLVGEGALGSLGLGGKLAWALSERWSVSVVPEVFLEPQGAALGGSMSANAALDLGAVGAWAHGGITQGGTQDLLLAGGGLSVPLGRSGLYANAAYASSGGSFVGAGGWWAPTGGLQLDLGCDVAQDGSAVVSLGASVGR